MKASRETLEGRGDSLSDEIVRRLQQSVKYRRLCEATLQRFAFEASKRFSAEKKALQWAKRKLHQSFGAFMSDRSFGRIDAQIGRLSRCGAAAERKELCRQILKVHVSTRERVPLLGELYPRIFQVAGRPAKIVDLACGLNPFSIPWMGLSAGADYLAVDSNRRLVDTIGAFFAAAGVPGKAVCADLFSFTEKVTVDLMLLLKTLPCLERQRPGAGLEIIRKLRCRHLVVSFPTATLGGKNKGLAAGHRKYAEGIVAELRVPVTRFEYPSELFYLFDLHG